MRLRSVSNTVASLHTLQTGHMEMPQWCWMRPDASPCLPMRNLKASHAVR